MIVQFAEIMKEMNYSIYDDYFKKELDLYQKWIELYTKHNIEENELILDYFWENEIYFNDKERDEIIGMYKKELSVFHNPLKKDLWL